MSNVQPYLQHLVETIGPRPTSSDTERVAAEWIHSVFQSHGLASTVQDFETPRSHAVADAVAYLALVVVVALIGVAGSGWFAWLLWVILALLAVSCFMSARGRQTLSILMPKGPSQNVVARYAPHSQRGERRRKVVVVAHYDTAVPTMLGAPATVRTYEMLVNYARYLTYAIPVVALIYVLPIGALEPAHRWVWYLTLVASLLPLALGLNALTALFVKRFSPGANTNASGVAALLAVVDDLVGESRNVSSPSETSRIPRNTSAFPALGGARGQSSAFDDAELFAGAAQPGTGSDLPDDFSWASSSTGSAFGGSDDLDLAPATASGSGYVAADPYAAAGSSVFADDYDRSAVPSPASSAPDAPSLREARDNRTSSFATVEFAAVPEESQQTVSFAPVASSATPYGEAPAADVLGPDVISLGEQAPTVQPMDFGDRGRKRSIFDFLRREPAEGDSAGGEGFMSRSAKKRRGGKHSAGSADSAAWLGLADDFEPTSAGEEIGSWDNFSSEDEGWKGGWAEGDLIEDSNYAEEEAARIRRRVAESATVSLDDKEVWFVATGAGAEGNAGMRALLAEYGNELRGAAFINLESVGAGQLHWLSHEGVHGDVRATSRLVSIAKRASKDTGILAKASKLSGQTTDATVALRANVKAFTLTRLVDGARLETAATTDDILSTVDEGLVAETAAYVSELVRQS